MAQVLVVEDDETIGRTLTSSLGVHGHTARWVMTGAAALSAAEQQPFDLALLDLGLPDMDGVDVCRRLRVAQPGCVLVVLTARDEEIDVVVGLEAGADDYLTKPFRLAELLARVAAHLRRGPATALALVPVVNHRRCRWLVRCRSMPWPAGPTWASVEIVLRAKEFDLLARLAAEPGAAITPVGVDGRRVG